MVAPAHWPTADAIRAAHTGADRNTRRSDLRVSTIARVARRGSDELHRVRTRADIPLALSIREHVRGNGDLAEQKGDSAHTRTF